MKPEEKILLEATLCFLVRGDEVLLAKKTKKIGKGCWNGYGGGPEPEDGGVMANTAIRELEEESGIRTLPEHLSKVAIVDFHNTTSDGEIFICRVHTYIVTHWDGDVVETEEMATPTWFPIHDLPREMMLADRTWLPLILSGKKIIAEAHYGPFQQTLLREVIVREVDELPGN